MITLGIDLAASPANTAVAKVSWTDGHARVLWVKRGSDDFGIERDSRDSDKIGIDCPLGWPLPFVEFINASATNRPTAAARSIENRRQLAYRRTDLQIMTSEQDQPLRPLSVAADRIAHAAFRCAGLLPLLEPTLDRSGHGRVVEVYPAGSLKRWGLPYRKYKGRAGRAERAGIIEALALVVDVFPMDIFMQESDHCLDAVIAALAARAAALGCATLPGDDDLEVARAEGWIALPTVSLAELGALNG